MAPIARGCGLGNGPRCWGCGAGCKGCQNNPMRCRTCGEGPGRGLRRGRLGIGGSRAAHARTSGAARGTRTLAAQLGSGDTAPMRCQSSVGRHAAQGAALLPCARRVPAAIHRLGGTHRLSTASRPPHTCRLQHAHSGSFYVRVHLRRSPATLGCTVRTAHLLAAPPSPTASPPAPPHRHRPVMSRPVMIRCGLRHRDCLPLHGSSSDRACRRPPAALWPAQPPCSARHLRRVGHLRPERAAAGAARESRGSRDADVRVSPAAACRLLEACSVGCLLT